MIVGKLSGEQILQDDIGTYILWRRLCDNIMSRSTHTPSIKLCGTVPNSHCSGIRNLRARICEAPGACQQAASLSVSARPLRNRHRNANHGNVMLSVPHNEAPSWKGGFRNSNGGSHHGAHTCAGDSRMSENRVLAYAAAGACARQTRRAAVADALSHGARSVRLQCALDHSEFLMSCTFRGSAGVRACSLC